MTIRFFKPEHGEWLWLVVYDFPVGKVKDKDKELERRKFYDKVRAELKVEHIDEKCTITKSVLVVEDEDQARRVMGIATKHGGKAQIFYAQAIEAT